MGKYYISGNWRIWGNKEGVVDIQELCGITGVPFFFRQWGGKNKKKSGSELNSRHYKETPMVKTT